MNQLVRLDPTSLGRALIGFDILFDQIERRHTALNGNYPPHNVLKTGENDYEIQIAVSGFDKKDITVEVDQDRLIITGERAEENDSQVQFLHRGLATRDFVKTLTMAEFMEVGDAVIKNGILTIKIQRIVPDALKPRAIKIQGE
jgi:molecular chaperone IbpA